MSEDSPAAEIVRLTTQLPREKKRVIRSIKQVGFELGGAFSTIIVEANAAGHPAMATIAMVGGVSCFGAGIVSYSRMLYYSLRHDRLAARLDTITVTAFNDVVQHHAEFRDAFAGIDVLELNDSTEDLE